MGFVQVGMPPTGMTLVDIDKLTHAAPQEEGSRLILGTQYLYVPHMLAEFENLLAGRERTGDGEEGSAGLHVQ